MRPPTRLAALMELPVMFVFTHDSIGLGQDGPTHQPIEQLAALRAIPDLIVLARRRQRGGRGVARRFCADRAGLPGPLAPGAADARPHRYAPADGLAEGAYVLADAAGGEPRLILIATGARCR